MLSYPRRSKSGQITCYLNRTYHVLTTREREAPWMTEEGVVAYRRQGQR